MSKNQNNLLKTTVTPVRSQLPLWYELSDVEQQSLSGGFYTQGDVDRPIILGSMRNDKAAYLTMVHELGHAHGRGH